MFFNVEGILFDVWDNRQMRGLKNYVAQLDDLLDDLDAKDTQKSHARRLISEIKDIERFDDLYKLIGFHYIIDASGKLDKLEAASFDVVVSAGVLEHIHKDTVSEFVQDIAAVLKPGGFTFHTINLRDHLTAYDKSVSAKQYLQYPDHTWKRWFENDVQYFNRIQRSEWLELFRKAGLVLIEEEIESVDLSGVRVAKTYQQFDVADLSCGGLNILYHKPK